MSNIFSINDPIHISLFKKICETFKNLSDLIYIKITTENINFQVIDNVKISILNIHFDKKYFDIFDVNNTDYFCININDFTKILKNFSKMNTIIFQLIKEQNILSITSNIENSIKKNFKINLLDTSVYNWINIDNLNSNNLKLSILSKTLYTIISELNVFSDYLTIKKYKNSNILEFIINDEQNNIYSKYQINDINILNIKNIKEDNIEEHIEEDIELIVSLNYLNNFKLFSNFNYTCFSISNNNPLHINLSDTYININYMLAPKLI